MADQPITSLPIKTASGMSATDYLLGIDSAEGYQMLIQDLGDYIIQHATSSLAGQSQTLASVINAINTRLTCITKSVDLNTLTTSGYYYILGGSANRPIETNGLLSVVTDNDVTQQIYSAYSSTNMYIRMKSGTTWHPWQKMAIDSDDILPAERVSIPSNSDMDTYINPGVFSIDSDAVAATISHLPRSSSGKVIVLTRGNNASYVQQRYIPTSSAPLEYVRNYNAGTWSDWEQLPTRAEIVSLNNSMWKAVDSAGYNAFGSFPVGSLVWANNTRGVYSDAPNYSAFHVFTMQSISGYVSQRAIEFQGEYEYIRTKVNGVWGNWVLQPTRAEVDALASKSLDCLQINVSGITVNSSTKLEDLYPNYFKTNYGAYAIFLRSDMTADGSYMCFFRHNYAGYSITEIYKGTNAQTPIIDSNGVLKTLSSTSPIQVYGFAIMMERW